jgi:hypothetical protein
MKARRSLYAHPKPFSEESSAPRRRLAAGRATEQLPGSAVGSLARWQVASPPSHHGGRAPHALPPTGTRFGVQQAVGSSWGPAVRIPAVPWSPCLHPRSASKCPVSGVSVQCPRRAMSTRPVSSVRASGCPGVDVRRPASVSARSASASAVSALGDFVERVGAAGGHTARRAWVWPPCYIRERRGPCWASGDVGQDLAVVMGGARAAGQGRPPDRPGTRRLSARIARRSRNSVRALCTPSAPWLRRSSGPCLPASGRP